MHPDRAIILAAGSSIRMGTQKLLLPFMESTIIGTVVQQVLSSRVESVLVVLGADNDRVRYAIDPLPVDYCFNRHHFSGMLSSIQHGFNSLPENTGSVLVFLGDQPRVRTDIINQVLEAYHGADPGKGIVVPVFNGRKGHPLLVDYRYKQEVMNLDPDIGLRSLMQLYPDDILHLEVTDPGILADIDTRSDYMTEIKRTNI
jgi:molybdenum cofactor cytidylyltransferase